MEKEEILKVLEDLHLHHLESSQRAVNYGMELEHRNHNDIALAYSRAYKLVKTLKIKP